MEGEFGYIKVNNKKKPEPKRANEQLPRASRPKAPTQAPTIRDRKMSHGKHKGKMFTEIILLDSSYPEKLTARFPDLEKHPNYVSEFLAWSTIWRVNNNVAVPSDGRTKHGSLPKKQPNACIAGCTRFTKLGSSQHESRITCLECGHGDVRKRVETPTYEPQNCPHEELDRRGSTKNITRIYCKQCSEFIDARDRDATKRVDRMATKLTVASTDQQLLAEQILDEQELTKEEVGMVFDLYQKSLLEYMSTRESIL